MIAPIIGPVIDRAAGGRRTVIQLVAAARVVLAVLMAMSIDELTLFPLVFAALVLQKTYIVSKQALVPSVVRTEADLVEANSKLGVIAGLTGFVAVIPAALIQATADQGVGHAALLGRPVRLRPARARPASRPTSSPPGRSNRPSSVQLHSIGVQLAAMAMLLLRASVGFVFFHLAFWLRSQSAGTVWFAVAVGMSALATMAGNAIAPCLRRAIREEMMLAGALALSTVAGLLAALVGDVLGGVGLAVAVNFAAAIGRLGVREHRPARRTPGQPRSGVRPLRDPLPARLGGGRPDPDHHRDPRLGRLPRGRPGVPGGRCQLHRRDPLVDVAPNPPATPAGAAAEPAAAGARCRRRACD